MGHPGTKGPQFRRGRQRQQEALLAQPVGPGDGPLQLLDQHAELARHGHLDVDDLEVVVACLLGGPATCEPGVRRRHQESPDLLGDGGRLMVVLVDAQQLQLADQLVEVAVLPQAQRDRALHQSDEHNSESAAIAEEIQGLLVSPTHARIAGRRAAEQARDDHLEFVDVEMAMPREFGVLVEQLQRAVARADRLCEEGRLLTLASPAELRALRAWMTHEVLGQTTRGAEPMAWPAWLAATPVA